MFKWQWNACQRKKTVLLSLVAFVPLMVSIGGASSQVLIAEGNTAEKQIGATRWT
jgi:hypothetical protein